MKLYIYYFHNFSLNWQSQISCVIYLLKSFTLINHLTIVDFLAR